MTKKYIISVDQGTTSTRAILYNKNLIPQNIHQIEIKQFYPKEGWVEQDPEEIWKSVKLCINKLLLKSKVRSTEIKSIGITNQRETTILWNKKTGKPIYNAIVWQDRRTSNYCIKIKTNSRLKKSVQKISGLIIDPYFSATKIKWILDNVANIKYQIKNRNILFGTVDTWLIWKLTNHKKHLTDITNASRTMLFDINNKIWSTKLTKIFRIPESILPKVVANVHNFGTTSIFGGSIMIGGVAGDQQAALIGQACFEKNISKSTYGTGCFFLINIGKKPKFSKNKLLTTIAYQINDKTFYCLEGSIFSAGSVIQWLRDGIKIIKSASDTEKLYNRADKNQNIQFVPAFTGMGAPYWNSNVRGSIYGLTQNTTSADITKAAIQSVCLQTKDLILAIEKDINAKISEIRIDGGMISNKYFIQFLSDILDVKIIVPKYSETTALGAAYLAALQCGFLKDTNEIKRKWRKSKTYYPKMQNQKRNNIYSDWIKAVKKTLYLVN